MLKSTKNGSAKNLKSKGRAVMNPVEAILAKYPLMILDGAFATELEGRGFAINDELWSANALLKAPELVKEVHRSYLEAGADAVSSASYQATIEGFRKRGLTEEEAKELIRLSVRLVRETVEDFWQALPEATRTSRPKPLAVASVGPYGAYLADGSEYKGHYGIGEMELRRFHSDRLGLLLEEKPDLLACETLPCLIEAQALVHELENFPQAYAWVSFSCRNSELISDGTPIAECASWLDKVPQVVAIGLNCTAPQYVVGLIKEIRKHTSKPVVVYPNSGETYDATTKTWRGSPVSYADYAQQWYKDGAKLIGGCCRTTPKDIAAVAAWTRK